MSKSNSDCLFCKIVSGEGKSDIVHENDSFLVIKNKFPNAPVHLLVLAKEHVLKQDTQRGKNTKIWGGFYKTVSEVVQKEGLWPNYQLVVNAPGMAHFDHEHIHIVSGKDLFS